MHALSSLTEKKNFSNVYYDKQFFTDTEIYFDRNICSKSNVSVSHFVKTIKIFLKKSYKDIRNQIPCVLYAYVAFERTPHLGHD